MSIADKYKSISLADKYSHLASSDDSFLNPETPASAPVEQREPTNMAETFAKSMAKGATFSFSDELGGALQSALDTAEGLVGESPSEVNEKLRAQGFTGDSLEKSIYRQGQEEALKDINQAEQDNPGTAMAGNIAGAVLPSGLLAKIIGGGAAAASAATKIPMAQRVLTSLAQGSAGQGGIANLALAGAAGGGVEGALQGAGTAKDVSEIPEEAIAGASTGTKWGGIGGGLFGLLKNVGSTLAKTPVGQDIGEYFNLGQKHNVSGFDTADRMATQATLVPTAEQSIDEMTNEIGRVAEARDAALKKMPSGLKVDLGAAIEGKPTYEKALPKYDFAENLKTEDISNLKKYQKARMAAENNNMLEVMEHPPEIKQELSNIDNKIAEIISNPETRANLMVTAPANLREGLEEVSRKVGDLIGNQVEGVATGDELSKLLKQSQVGKLLEKASTNTSAEAKMIKDLLAQKKMISLHPKTEKVLTPNVHVENTLAKLKSQAEKSLQASGIEADVDELVNDIPGLIEAKKAATSAPKINAGMFDNLSPNQQTAMADLVEKAQSMSGKDLSGEQILDFWKSLKNLESTTKNVPELREFIKSLEGTLSTQIGDMGGDFGKANATLKKLYDVKEGLTGVRSASKTRDTSAQEIKKLYNASNTEQALYGDTVELQQAKDAIAGLPQESKDVMGNVVNKVEETRKLGALFDQGANRMLYNPLSKTFTRAGASAVGKFSNEIPGAVKTAGKVVGQTFSPEMLYNPATMQKLSAKSPTLAKLYERLADQSTSEAKRRAIHNMLLNNPIVRREIEKDN